MARSDVYEVHYNNESSFAENANSPASNTWGTRIPVKSVSASFTQERPAQNDVIQVRLHDRDPGFQGPREGELTIVFPLPGYGATTAGSISSFWAYDLLKDALGGGDVSMVGDLAESSSTAILLKLTSATMPAGGIARVGAVGDGRAEGHATVIDAYSTPDADLLCALPAAPDAADVVYAAAVAYLTEDLGTTKRFLIGYKPSGAQWHAMGCHAKNVELRYSIGGEPECAITYHVAYWDRAAETTPSGTALSTYKTAAVTGQDLFFQTVGTTTRNTLKVTELTLSMNYELSVKRTTGATGTYQVVTGYERGPVRPSLEFVVQDWANTYETLWDSDGPDSTLKHILFESVRSDGRTSGFYLPSSYAAGTRPQYEDAGGVLAVRARYEAQEGPDTSSDLTRSALRVFFA